MTNLKNQFKEKNLLDKIQFLGILYLVLHLLVVDYYGIKTYLFIKQTKDNLQEFFQEQDSLQNSFEYNTK